MNYIVREFLIAISLPEQLEEWLNANVGYMLVHTIVLEDRGLVIAVMMKSMAIPIMPLPMRSEDK